MGRDSHGWAFVILILVGLATALNRFVFKVDDPFEAAMMGLGLLITGFCLGYVIRDVTAWLLHLAGWRRAGE